MIAWVLGILTGWVLLAVVAGVVMGTAIRNADKPADELTEPEADDFPYAQRTWVA